MEQQKLNPVIVYVLSILGLLCCCIAGIGFIPSGIALVIAQKGLKKAALNQDDYDAASVKQMKTAKIVAIIILVINILYLIRTIYVIYTIGWDELTQEFMKAYEEALKNQGQ